MSKEETVVSHPHAITKPTQRRWRNFVFGMEQSSTALKEKAMVFYMDAMTKKQQRKVNKAEAMEDLIEKYKKGKK